MNVQQGDFKPLLFQPVQRMQHRVMLKSGRKNMHFPAFPAQLRGGTDRLIIRFASAGGKQDFLWLRPDELRDGFPGFLQDFSGLLTQGIQAGGIAVVLADGGDHRLNSGFTHAGCRGVIGIDHKTSLLPLTSCAVVFLQRNAVSDLGCARSHVLSREVSLRAKPHLNQYISFYPPCQ